MEKDVKEEFVKVRTEFSEYQKSFDKRLDDLFEEIRKPMFSYKELGAIAIAIISYTYFITRDFSGVKSMAETTKEKVELQGISIKETNKENARKTDKILEIVSDIKIDVAVLKENKKDNKNPTSAQRQQMVLDWANGKN
ncbi:MAG: hypothetical protein WAW57_15375 [Lutibacter sp.]